MPSINVRIEEELKQKADEVMKAAGTTPTAAITLLYQYIAEHGKLPFTVKTSLSTPNDTTLAILREMNGLHHYCWTTLDARLEAKKHQAMAVTLYIAGQITSIKSLLTGAQHSLSANETAQLQLLLDSLFNNTAGLLNTAPGEDGAQDLQNILDNASRVIFGIEKNHNAIP